MTITSHCLVGALVGTILTSIHPEQSFWILLCGGIAGGILPDIPQALQLLVDKMKKRNSFSEEKHPDFETSMWFIFKDVTHSHFLWIVLFLLSLCSSSQLITIPFFENLVFSWNTLLSCFGAGILSHWIMDVFTHTSHEFERTDQTMIWPFKFKNDHGELFKLSTCIGELWNYEDYRYPKRNGKYVVKTKKWEKDIQLLVFLAFLLFLLLSYK